VIRAYMKDGGTVYAFVDAGQLRRLLHDRPGQKPEGGKPVQVWVAYRERNENGAFTGELIEGGPAFLRFISKQSISHVEQDATTQDDRPARAEATDAA
jgi:hypothetical protein